MTNPLLPAARTLDRHRDWGAVFIRLTFGGWLVYGTQDNVFSFQVPCAATAGTAGATCQLTTTADTLLPGAVVERQRAIWQFDRVAVLDASDDPFLTQGVFIP